MTPVKWFKNERLIEMHAETSFTVYVLKIVIVIKGSENEDDSIVIKLIPLCSQRWWWEVLQKKKKKKKDIFTICVQATLEPTYTLDRGHNWV